jgi:plasmid stabilization system protein ParE
VMKQIIILPSALKDLEHGYSFYEFQERGLGDYFQESLFSDIESLRLYAGIHRQVFGYHALLSKRFPYKIYYLKESDTVKIQAVLDCRRDPKWLKTELAR